MKIFGCHVKVSFFSRPASASRQIPLSPGTADPWPFLRLTLAGLSIASQSIEGSFPNVARVAGHGMARPPLALDLPRFHAAAARNAASAPIRVMPNGARSAVALHNIPGPPSLIASLRRTIFVETIHAASLDAPLARAAARLPRPRPPLKGAHHFVIVYSGDIVVAVDTRLPIASLLGQRSQIHLTIRGFRLFVQHDALDEPLLHALAAGHGAGIPFAGSP